MCQGESVSYRPLLLTGDSINGVPGAVVGTVSLLDGLSDAGETTVFATFTGAVSSLNNTALITVGAEPRLLIREGDVGPGSDLIVANVGNAATSPAGGVAIRPVLGTTPTTGLVRTVYWLPQPSAAPELVVKSGDPAPGVPAGLSLNLFGLFGNVESDGYMTIRGYLQGPGIFTNNYQVLYRWNSSGSLELIAREGDPAPGFPSGVSLDSSLSPVVNRNRQSLVSGFLRGTSIGPTNDQAAFVSSDTGLQLLIKQSSLNVTFPGMFYHIQAGDLRSDGRAYSWASMLDLSQGFNGPVIVGGYAGSPLSVVRRSDGHVEGRSLTSISADFAINDRGNLAYVAQLEDSQFAVIYAQSEHDPASDRLLAVQGTDAPSTNAQWGRPLQYSDPLYLNENGVLVFQNILEGPTVDASNDGTIWATDAWGTLRLIAREGDPMTLSPGDVRIIASLNLDNIQLSETNIIAFHATFTNGTAGIVTATVPEPSAVAVCAGLLLTAFKMRRREQAGRQARNQC